MIKLIKSKIEKNSFIPSFKLTCEPAIQDILYKVEFRLSSLCILVFLLLLISCNQNEYSVFSDGFGDTIDPENSEDPLFSEDPEDSEDSLYLIAGNDGELSFSNVEKHSLTLNWSKATISDGRSNEDILYKIYVDEFIDYKIRWDNEKQINYVDRDLIPVAQGYDITSAEITGLPAGKNIGYVVEASYNENSTCIYTYEFFETLPYPIEGEWFSTDGNVTQRYTFYNGFSIRVYNYVDGLFTISYSGTYVMDETTITTTFQYSHDLSFKEPLADTDIMTEPTLYTWVIENQQLTLISENSAEPTILYPELLYPEPIGDGAVDLNIEIDPNDYGNEIIIKLFASDSIISEHILDYNINTEDYLLTLPVEYPEYYSSFFVVVGLLDSTGRCIEISDGRYIGYYDYGDTIDITYFDDTLPWIQVGYPERLSDTLYTGQNIRYSFVLKNHRPKDEFGFNYFSGNQNLSVEFITLPENSLLTSEDVSISGDLDIYYDDFEGVIGELNLIPDVEGIYEIKMYLGDFPLSTNFYCNVIYP